MTRDPYDRYYTPPWPTRLLIWDWQAMGVLPRNAVIGEPCCGRGDMCRVFVEEGYDTRASDLVPHADALRKYDAQTMDAQRYHELAADWPITSVITNPPYTCDHGTACSVLAGILPLGVPTAALLALQWLEACEDRRALFSAFGEPDLVCIIPRVEYEFPDKSGDNNPGPSVWVQWHLGDVASGYSRTIWKGPRDKARAQGQLELEGVA